MKIDIHMLSASKPIRRNNVINTYTKDGLYCVLMSDGIVKKYPLCGIFEITEFKEE